MATRTKTKQVVATCIGNALEWYDFSVYGYLAATMSKLFFPPGDEQVQLLSTFLLFGLAYVVRPIGGIVLAHYADKLGRKSILFAVIALMTLGVGMIAVTPTYATIGIAATAILVVARLIQGLSAGGEFGSSMSFLIEHAPPHLRGLYAGWQQAGQGAAALLAGIIGIILSAAFTPAQVDAGWWRLPFVIGLVIGPIGAYMRMRLLETPEFLAHQAVVATRPTMPFVEIFRTHKQRILISFGLVLGGAATVYVLFLFMPTYAIRTLHLRPQDAFGAPLAAGLMLTLFCPVSGYLSDLVGRKTVMAVSAILFALSIYPIFLWLNDTPTLQKLIVANVLFGLFMAGYAGPFGAALGELFAVGVRVTGMSVAYNLGVAAFGGFAPLIVQWLIGVTGSPLAPAWYVMAGLLLSIVATLAMPPMPRISKAAPALAPA